MSRQPACGFLIVLLFGSLVATGREAGSADRVPAAQPLLAQVTRVRQALDYYGSPLSRETQSALDRLTPMQGDEVVNRGVQEALDPFCLAIVQVQSPDQIAVRMGKAKPLLVEQGWRTFLVKVLNAAELTTTLRVTSPNAGQLAESPASEVEKRWLDLQMLDGRPLNPTLSGLELEYRILQVFSRDAGARQADLEFNVGRLSLPPSPDNAKKTALVRQWSFEKGTDGWRAVNHCRLEAAGMTLKVVSEGNDPYFATTVRAEQNRMVLRFRAKAPRDTYGALFWTTAPRPNFDGDHLAFWDFVKGNGDWQDYAVPFEPDGQLTGLRLDPGGQPDVWEFTDLALWYVDTPNRTSVRMPFTFETEASQVVKLRVRDENGKPCVACFEVRDERGRVYPSQAKRLAPDFFFHPQVYRANGETLRLPKGRYTIQASRGPESVPQTLKLDVTGETAPIDYQVRRWVDPSKRGWWSGDHHIHAAGCRHYSNPTEGVRPEDMQRHIQGEDLKVGANLTWGPCFDFQKQFFTGKSARQSRYPYLLRYDIEVSGFGSHQSGHLCLLRLKDQIYPGGTSKEHWPTLGMNTLRWAKRQGAVTGPAHSSIGLAPTPMRVDSPDGPNGLPSYAIPAYNGIGANEFIVDVTHQVPGPNGNPVPAIDFISTMNTDRLQELNMWYHTLNCGFRVRASGETDFPCVSGERVGLGRVYVKQSGRLTYDDWCQGILEGRSYVSDGYHHLMDFRAHSLGARGGSVEVGRRRSELRLSQAGTIRLSSRVAARQLGEDGKPKTVRVEAVVNGYPVAVATMLADGEERPVQLDVPIAQSSWVALRTYPNAHTNPIFVLVGNRPIRASKRSAEWCLRGVEQCWSQKERTYAPKELPQARADYDHARRVYREILSTPSTP